MRHCTLHEARKSRRLTQGELAKLADVSRATLCRIEAGQMLPRMTTVRRLEKALKTSLRFYLIADQEAAQ